MQLLLLHEGLRKNISVSMDLRLRGRKYLLDVHPERVSLKPTFVWEELLITLAKVECIRYMQEALICLECKKDIFFRNTNKYS